MARAARLKEKIDALFAELPEDSYDDLRAYMAAVHESQIQAYRGLLRNLNGFVVLWLALYAISKGVISEGSVAAFKVVNVRVLLIAGPPLLGWLFYVLSSAAVATELLMEALSRCYSHLIPKLTSLDLEYLATPPVFISVERYLQRESSRKWLNAVTDNWITAFSIFLLSASLAAVVHSSYLTYVAHMFPAWAVAISWFLASVLWVRGLLLWITANEFLFGK